VHLLVTFLPKITLSRLMNSLKGRPLGGCGRSFPDLYRHSWRAKRLMWSGSYFAGSVGGPPPEWPSR
jgi:putative transposase